MDLESDKQQLDGVKSSVFPAPSLALLMATKSTHGMLADPTDPSSTSSLLQKSHRGAKLWAKPPGRELSSPRHTHGAQLEPPWPKI